MELEDRKVFLKLSLWQNRGVVLTFVRAVFDDDKVFRGCSSVFPAPLAKGVACSREGTDKRGGFSLTARRRGWSAGWIGESAVLQSE